MEQVIEENKEQMAQMINQASKSWIVPSGIATVLSDIGEPNEEKYPAWEHAGDITFWYLDVTNGKLYQPKIIIIPNGGEYSEWTYVRTCESVQSQLESLQDTTTDLNSRISEFCAKHYIITSGYTKLIIKFTSSTGAFGFLYGRNSANNPHGAIFANNHVSNITNSGEYELSSDKTTLTCTLGTWAEGHILCRPSRIESITFE